MTKTRMSSHETALIQEGRAEAIDEIEKEIDKMVDYDEEPIHGTICPRELKQKIAEMRNSQQSVTTVKGDVGLEASIIKRVRNSSPSADKELNTRRLAMLTGKNAYNKVFSPSGKYELHRGKKWN